MSFKLEDVIIKGDIFKQESICRLCLSNDAFLNIFGEGIRIINIILECCPISISMDDELPKQICQQCMSTLNICEDFRQKCIQSDLELRNRLNQSNETIIKTEQDFNYDDGDTFLECNFKAEETFSEDSPCIDNIKTRKKKLKKITSKSVVGNEFTSKIVNKKKDRVVKVKKKGFRSEKIDKEPTTKSHLCPICGKIFVGKSSVSAHIKTHSNERPFLCSVCNKTFRTKSHLNLHSSAHLETRDFTCSQCTKSFKSKPDLKRHIAIIHQGSRRATCEICGKEMATRNNLKSHMLVHSGVKNWECTICSQKFTFKSSLKAHGRIHSGEKPYLCKFCDARFSIQRSLRDHERLHTGETPYQCPCCPKAFNQLSNMKSHFRHNHRDTDFDKVYKGPRKKRYNF